MDLATYVKNANPCTNVSQNRGRSCSAHVASPHRPRALGASTRLTMSAAANSAVRTPSDRSRHRTTSVSLRGFVARARAPALTGKAPSTTGTTGWRSGLDREARGVPPVAPRLRRVRERSRGARSTPARTRDRPRGLPTAASSIPPATIAPSVASRVCKPRFSRASLTVKNILPSSLRRRTGASPVCRT